jgi:hypothetical protein
LGAGVCEADDVDKRGSFKSRRAHFQYGSFVSDGWWMEHLRKKLTSFTPYHARTVIPVGVESASATESSASVMSTAVRNIRIDIGMSPAV